MWLASPWKVILWEARISIPAGHCLGLSPAMTETKSTARCTVQEISTRGWLLILLKRVTKTIELRARRTGSL